MCVWFISIWLFMLSVMIACVCAVTECSGAMNPGVRRTASYHHWDRHWAIRSSVTLVHACTPHPYPRVYQGTWCYYNWYLFASFLIFCLVNEVSGKGTQCSLLPSSSVPLTHGPTSIPILNSTRCPSYWLDAVLISVTLGSALSGALHSFLRVHVSD